MKENRKINVDWNKSFYSLSDGTTVTSAELKTIAEKYLTIYKSVGVTLLLCTALIAVAMTFDIAIEGFSDYSLTVGIIAAILLSAGLAGLLQFRFANRIRFGLTMMNFRIRQAEADERAIQRKK